MTMMMMNGGAGVYLLPVLMSSSSSSSPLRRLSPQSSSSSRAVCRSSRASRRRQAVHTSKSLWRHCSPRQWAVFVRARGGGADVKSEPFDDVSDSITFKDALISKVAVSTPLLGEEEEEEQGQEEGEEAFPKRWLIVILCFSAFLLCNMDRVNMSIAILPMSAEYNWNPATVGLIQSSFFWGYLLTQVAGGIWADTVGGKRVLGFGVVWWSIATALTPVAAKVGLPFLLLVRALMGIGESCCIV